MIKCPTTTIRITLTLVLVTMVCFAQTITISGTVKDASGNAIPGAEVKLEKVNKKATTDSNGKFSFAKTSTSSNYTILKKENISAHIRDGVLFLNVLEMQPVEINIYALNGKNVFTMKKTMKKGTHSITPDINEIGINIYKIKTGHEEVTLKNSSLAGFSDGSSLSLSKHQKRECVIYFSDILAVKKDGYLDYRIIVKDPNTNEMDVCMIKSAGTVIDADGNVYQSVKIGDQVWTTGSLKTTKYNDGTPITLISDGNQWKALSTAAYCHNNNKPENGKNGLLYNWYAASSNKIAPKSWRVPTHDEQLKLQNYLITSGYNYDGTKDRNKVGKAMAAKTDWAYKTTNETGQPVDDTIGMVGNNMQTNNSTGFSALPVGSRWNDGSFHSLEHSLYMWSCTPQSNDHGWHTSIHTWLPAYGYNHHSKKTGFAVRLIRD